VIAAPPPARLGGTGPLRWLPASGDLHELVLAALRARLEHEAEALME
jgi:hypothetical protein